MAVEVWSKKRKKLLLTKMKLGIERRMLPQSHIRQFISRKRLRSSKTGLWVGCRDGEMTIVGCWDEGRVGCGLWKRMDKLEAGTRERRRE
ncbi:hypothetical protein DVH24_036936 [Malus domestica]|uniref:Uncharacterized protein n=1 Tax=Malus domestica TaxID=3750 RepID=A0A498IKB8_MALDO|nr:hypothetical protein DVH24_036936 [Malus domestica]